jgi:hypothetical protein
MIRPHCFGPNAETAQSNFFQQSITVPKTDIQARAAFEFDAMIGSLADAGVELIVFEDIDQPAKPDAVFPNNWVSFHADGRVFLYPMAAPTRRAERRLDIIEALSRKHAFHVADIVDLSSWEERGGFLEGTGSMVLDRVGRIAYAALSSRTHMPVLADFAQRADYEISAFDAVDAQGRPVYHTNVMMGIGEKFAVICTASISDEKKRAAVLAQLNASGREVVEITLAQMERFAGNLIELAGPSGTSVIVMSASAQSVMSKSQLNSLARCGRVLSVPIDTIERVGGGSVRCMMAEVFLPR